MSLGGFPTLKQWLRVLWCEYLYCNSECNTFFIFLLNCVLHSKEWRPLYCVIICARHNNFDSISSFLKLEKFLEIISKLSSLFDAFLPEMWSIKTAADVILHFYSELKMTLLIHNTQMKWLPRTVHSTEKYQVQVQVQNPKDLDPPTPGVLNIKTPLRITPSPLRLDLGPIPGLELDINECQV